MLNFYLSLFLISGGITAFANNCSRRPQCPWYEGPTNIPEEIEEVLNACKSYIPHAECVISYNEICSPPEDEDGEYLRQTQKNAFNVIKEICTEDTFLHTGVVDNFQCLRENWFGRGFRDCDPFSERPFLFPAIIDDLVEEGLMPGPDGLTDQRCILQMTAYACKALKVERECGTHAMNVFVEALQKVGPGLVAGPIECKNYGHLFDDVVRLRRKEEEKHYNSTSVVEEE